MDGALLPIASLLSLILLAVPLILLARVSHWTHATQAKLDETNKLLDELLRRP